MKAKNTKKAVSIPVKKQAVALKDLKTKKDPKGGAPISFGSKTGKNPL